ncbi:mersacidin/lichenicidin family type 2 lantibiotic [Microtetraspora malaysiensis]|uniref:mersacidin/lichenicidin family type 2 lantibiotic n=1 Tax=Microtetraspora malaysiensis TaxID=161358 RepID=UPI003D8F31BC
MDHDLIRAWKDEDHRDSLPAGLGHPAGDINLSTAADASNTWWITSTAPCTFITIIFGTFQKDS